MFAVPVDLQLGVGWDAARFRWLLLLAGMLLRWAAPGWDAARFRWPLLLAGMLLLRGLLLASLAVCCQVARMRLMAS